MSSFRGEPGLTARADGALLHVELILADRSIPSAARLALIAARLREEPVLECESPAAGRARRSAAAHAAKVGMAGRLQVE